MNLALPLTDRIARLAQSFQELKERVRDAVATEMGKVVADAVRDWITGALTSRRQPSRDPEMEEYRRYDDGWDGEPKGWEDDEPVVRPVPVDPRPQSPRWAAALSIGVVAARWLIARRLPFVPSLGIGVLAGLCAVAGGPLVQSVLVASTAAADLAGIARPEPQHSD